MRHVTLTHLLIKIHLNQGHTSVTYLQTDTKPTTQLSILTTNKLPTPPPATLPYPTGLSSFLNETHGYNTPLQQIITPHKQQALD
jgi:hypothetical protein